ncbi:MULTISPECIES: glycosyltransferase family 2 protein [Sphingobacterium]|uniref:Glycosyltransferase family 2 protein n=1 Tax=Sphingobacterium populi TaxID=1812824 RepID=A0ABW5UDS7_9SPHI|nr:glycosyltransferase family A protein [Sphingobacterium sp. CFCC 11742]
MINQPLVTIITPIFNAEKTLSSCLKSLARLTYKNLQFVFIDDCSSDNGIEIVNEFLSTRENDKLSILIQHQKNQGVAAARNSGLDHASGKYVYYVDADDELETDTIRAAVNTAEHSESDIVGFSWYLAFEKNKRPMNQPSFISAEDALQKLMNGTMRWNLWLFLVKRSLYEDHQIRFLPGVNMGEDMMVMIKLFAVAKNVSFLDQHYYLYRQSNSESLTKTYSESHMSQVAENLHVATDFLATKSWHFDLEKHTAFLMLNIKLPLLISSKTSQYKRWLTWFAEANVFAGKNTAVSWRVRLIERAAVSQHFWIIKLYYYFVIRVVYGIIYK